MPHKRRSEEPIRLQVMLARAGVASRRASEDLIRRGRVRVNGETVTELGTKVVPGRDRVEVNGRRIEVDPPLWIALHKPQGYVSTRDDPQGRRTIYDLVPQHLHRLFHVGRLDKDSEGLLLLTNDGQTANRLMHPRYGVTKEYMVDVEGDPGVQDLNRLITGVRLDDGVARAVAAEPLFQIPGGRRLRIELQEGKNRELRRMLEAIGHPVRALSRRRFGPVWIGKLRLGEWRYLGAPELQALREAGQTTSST